MATGQQVALQPALAGCSVSTSMTRPSASQVLVARARSRRATTRSVTSNTAPSRLEAVSSGPNTRKFVLAGWLASRRAARAQHAGGLAAAAPGAGHVDGVVAEVGQAQVAQQQAAVGVRVGAHAAGALRAPARRVPATSAPVVVEQLLGPVAAQPLLEQAQVLRVVARSRRAAPGGSARCPRPDPVDLVGPGPALGRAQHDHRPARALARHRPSRARLLDRGDLVERPRPAAAAMRWCIAAGSSPSTKCGL